MRNDIEHPVVNDADYKIWSRYHCTSWPSLRVIDPEGNLVAQNGGEIDFATLDGFFKKVLPYYRQQGELNEKPVRFDLESRKAAPTPLRYPGKILADETGKRLFIADSSHNRIVIASLPSPSGRGAGGEGAAVDKTKPKALGEPNQKSNLIAVIGASEIGRTDGDYQTARFHHPQGMILNGDTLYVADTENHLLRKVDLKAQKVTTIAGTGEESHFSWPGLDPENPRAAMPERFVGAPLNTPLNSPWALSIVGRNLFIANAGSHQIWKMPLDESEIGPYAGNGREDIVDGPLLPKTPYEIDFASFAQPSGLTTDGKTLFVADSEGSSIRAVPTDSAGKVLTILGTANLDSARLFTFGDADGPPEKARLQHCLGITYHNGKLYVADTYNDKIKSIDLKTATCQTLAGTGKPGHADSNLLSPSGRGAGGEGAGNSSNATAANATASFFEPAGLSYAAGKLYIADTNNHLIRVLDLANNAVSTLEIAGLAAPTAHN
jgi:sugar lactone lactonase YvrE